jgi:hypothetical protein
MVSWILCKQWFITAEAFLFKLGHSDSKVTQRYAHLSTKTLRDTANSASAKIKAINPRKRPQLIPDLHPG